MGSLWAHTGTIGCIGDPTKLHTASLGRKELTRFRKTATCTCVCPQDGCPAYTFSIVSSDSRFTPVAKCCSRAIAHVFLSVAVRAARCSSPGPTVPSLSLKIWLMSLWGRRLMLEDTKSCSFLQTWLSLVPRLPSSFDATLSSHCRR